MYKTISSIQNPLIKQIVKLQDKARERKKTKSFVIEGLREISLAKAGKYQFEAVLFVPEIIGLSELSYLSKSGEVELIEITKSVYQKIAYRNSTEGVVAIAKIKIHELKQLQLSKNPLVLIAEAPEKPGNIGAILRTADAANIDAVIIANPTTDLYNPNIIRSSVGCLFTNQIATGSTQEIIHFLQENGIQIFCAALKDDALTYHTQDFTQPTAIVVGTEATGLSDEWLQNATQNIIIPMKGEIDSMNVSVTTGILVFEAIRQRS